MRNRYLNGLLTLGLLAPVAGWAYASTMTLTPQSRIWVEGTSTVRGFECKAPAVTALIEATGPDAANLVLAGTKGITRVDVTIPAKKLDCANGTMNGHMFKAIKADAAPEIKFSLASYDLTRAGDEVKVRMNGKLSLGGVEKAITLDADAKAGPNGTLLVTGSEELKLSDYGLKAPTLMMGTMKVADAVKVRYELALKN